MKRTWTIIGVKPHTRYSRRPGSPMSPFPPAARRAWFVQSRGSMQVSEGPVIPGILARPKPIPRPWGCRRVGAEAFAHADAQFGPWAS